MMLETDFLIVGAGIAGASIAFRLASDASVILIDMEDQAGYHTTGRSAAFYAETYGGPLVQPLTSASKSFFHNPPSGFAEHPLISPLGAIHIYRSDTNTEAESLCESLRETLPNVRLLSRAEVLAKIPQLVADGIAGGIYDPDCSSLDVAALHQGFLKGAKQHDAKLLTGAALEAACFDGARWHVETRRGDISAKILVNAAGAWADQVAALAGVSPVGVQPLRRTVATIENPAGLPFDRSSPIVMEVGEEHYFKPEGQGYLVTPGDEVLTPPGDVQPELEDVALAVHQFENATGGTVSKVEAKWAGLRTFASDRAPVIGFAPDMPAFFWSVGQGGFGIQTAPAWSELAAALLMNVDLPEALKAYGVAAEAYTPARFLQKEATV